jgi:hypothetical protein
MKTIIQYVHAYINEEWNSRLFFIVAIFLLLSFGINYIFDFEVTIIRRLENPIEQFVFYFFFYAFPFCVTVTAYAIIHRRTGFTRNAGFWKLCVLSLVLLALYIVLHNVPSYVYVKAPELLEFFPKELRWYAARYAANLLPGLIVFFPVALYWRSRDRAGSHLYGFSSSSINLKTYAGILLLLVPVVVAASFSSDFQAAYPRYKFGLPQNVVGGERTALVGIFETCYGVDFIFVEFFFRGFMVMAFARYLGKGSILPMVVVYAFIHFQKPLGEAIGSVAGGLVLGIISYETGSIYGGIILHLGVAYMMEIAGTLQLLMRKAI